MEVLYYIAATVVGVFILIQAGKRVVRSLAAMARFLRLSEFVLSFVLLAFATSLPELAVGINSALSGVSSLSLGDIIGTNITNFTLILGVVAIVGKRLELKDHAHFRKNRLFEFGLVLLPLLLLIDGVLSRVDGAILLTAFAVNLFRMLDIEDILQGKKILRPHLAEHAHNKAESGKDFLRNLGVFIVSAAFLLVAAFFIVSGASNVSAAIGLPHILVGALVVGVGTSLPELTIGIRGVRRGTGGVSLGDIFGAAVINANLTLGIVALISPIVLADKKLLFSGIIFTAGAFLLAIYFLRGKTALTRKEGIVLVALYVLFLITEILLHFYIG